MRGGRFDDLGFRVAHLLSEFQRRAFLDRERESGFRGFEKSGNLLGRRVQHKLDRGRRRLGREFLEQRRELKLGEQRAAGFEVRVGGTHAVELQINRHLGMDSHKLL